MNYTDISTLINILAAGFVARTWGWVGVVAYAITFAIMAVFFK